MITTDLQLAFHLRQAFNIGQFLVQKLAAKQAAEQERVKAARDRRKKETAESEDEDFNFDNLFD